MAFDIMTYKGEFERRLATPTLAHEDAVLLKATQFQIMYELMRERGIDLPTRADSTLCNAKYCDWWAQCPQGEVLDVG